MPPAGHSLRLLAFAVPAALAVAAVQPILAALVEAGPWDWALSLSGPAMLASGTCLLAARLTDRRGSGLGEGEPDWLAAWLLMPGAFLFAGAAAMCLIGAVVPVAPARPVEWTLLGLGALAWVPALWWVRHSAARRAAAGLHST